LDEYSEIFTAIKKYVIPYYEINFGYNYIAKCLLDNKVKKDTAEKKAKKKKVD
jgi:hypothetical protein